MGMYTERIKRGAALLDVEQPGWRERVDVDTLDLGSCGRCVLGQLLGTYSDAYLIGLNDEDEAADCGFVLGIAEEGLYSDLTQEWREYIRETRTAVA